MLLGSLQLFISTAAVLSLQQEDKKTSKLGKEDCSTEDGQGKECDQEDSLLSYKASGISNSSRLPVILLGMILMPTVAATETFVVNFLAIYLKDKHGKDTSVTGIVLMICGVVYCLSTVLFGYLTDKGLSRALTIAAGGAVVVIGTLLIDPAWFGVVWPSFVYPGIVVGLLEAGSAMVQVSALPLLVLHDEEPDIELSTEKMTRVYNTGFFIGSFIGPLVGSALSNFLSFSSTFTFFAVFTGAVIVILLGVHLKTGTLLSIRSKVANLNEYTILP